MNSAAPKRGFAVRRVCFAASAAATVFLGLASRRFRSVLPAFAGAYAGDTLWALMVYLGLGALFPTVRAGRRLTAALLFSYSIETSQLYHAPWIDAVRATTLGGLVLGFGFLWSDWVCYTVGTGAGFVAETVAERFVSRR